MSSDKTSTPKTHSRKSRSKSHDEDATGKTESKKKSEKKGERKVTRSKSHDDSIERSNAMKRIGNKRQNSVPSGKMMSLEDGLSKVAGPSLLQRKDFGRSADDDDTFCGTGTVDGEIESGRLRGIRKSKKPTSSPFGTAASPVMPKSDPFGSAFARRDSESESDEEVDFFADTSNPFKDLKKKNAASKRTAL